MYKMIQKSRDKKGFTLVELLVVLAIIAILAAIAVPVYNSQMNKARLGVDEANLRAAESMAVTAYLLKDAENTKPVTYYGSKEKVDGQQSDGLEMVTTTGSSIEYFESKASDNDGMHIEVKVEGGKVIGSGWVK